MTISETQRHRLVLLGLGIAMAVSVVLLLSIDRHLGFVSDDWELLIHRSHWSAGSILDPFHEHIIIAPSLIYNLLLRVFGMSSAMPWFVVSTLLFASCAALLFVLLRRRVGDVLALVLVLPILFLGASVEDLLWAFQMGFFGSIAAGLGMLIALDRGDRRGDRIACTLLAISISFSSLGLVFLAGAAVDLLLGGRPRRGRA